jgi:hypothetical protein
MGRDSFAGAAHANTTTKRCAVVDWLDGMLNEAAGAAVMSA